MPNNPDAGSAFLVDPMGHKPEPLDKNEYRYLRNVLDVSRNESQQPLWDMLVWLLHISTLPAIDQHVVLTNAVYHYLAEVDDDGAGVLAERLRPADNIAILSDEEMPFLKQALAVHRAGGWFPDWLSIQLKTMTSTSIPDDRFPSPLRIAATLVDDIREYDERLYAARTLAHMRPDLVMPAPVPESTPEPPAAAPEPEAKPAKRKKASRA